MGVPGVAWGWHEGRKLWDKGGIRVGSCGTRVASGWAAVGQGWHEAGQLWHKGGIRVGSCGLRIPYGYAES